MDEAEGNLGAIGILGWYAAKRSLEEAENNHPGSGKGWAIVKLAAKRSLEEAADHSPGREDLPMARTAASSQACSAVAASFLSSHQDSGWNQKMQRFIWASIATRGSRRFTWACS